MNTTTVRETETTILARFLGNDEGQIPADLAPYIGKDAGQIPADLARRILEFRIGERDKARMHDLITRNQEDGLTAEETEEMFAFGWAGDVLSILKSKSRRVLGVKLEEFPIP